MQWVKYSQELNRKLSAITTVHFMLNNMEISADLHKVICCQDVPRNEH